MKAGKGSSLEKSKDRKHRRRRSRHIKALTEVAVEAGSWEAFCDAQAWPKKPNYMNIRRYIDVFVNDEEKRINRTLRLAKGDKGYVSGHALFVQPIFRRQSQSAAHQIAKPIPAAVVAPPLKEPSDDSIQVIDSVPQKSKSNTDNNNSSNTIIVISDSDYDDESFPTDISTAFAAQSSNRTGVESMDQSRLKLLSSSSNVIVLSDSDSDDEGFPGDISTTFATKSPNQAGVESVKRGGPEVSNVSNFSNFTHDAPEELPVPGSDRWFEPWCPGLLVNGVIDLNVLAQNIDLSLSAKSFDERRGVPRAQQEPRATSGIFCCGTYLNGISCIVKVSKRGDFCELHCKGESRQVTCTSFSKDGIRCKEQSHSLRHSLQDEWGYLCFRHRRSMLQRGHLYRFGMPASLLARLEVSSSILLKDQKEGREYKDLTFNFAGREETIITAEKFNGNFQLCVRVRCYA
ncbi:hypothetical protein EMPS_07832 [Entomortierella parvispora]|uniref:Uncharacterized protein n=1 Tax=Entomortierella parvispora TaxID=205924 RepID=A0A9P3LYQ8_9FUNG|nr:hypothetical protein EMPS_07832 [Entomortierella parvispora]